MAKCECFALSERGNLETNDDFASLYPELGMFVVADGLGGHAGGSCASKIAVETFWENLQHLPPSSRTEASNLRQAIQAANIKIRSLAESDPMLSGMGTTLSALVVNGNKGKIVHVGDSRIYLFRDNTLRLLTNDHSLVAELIEQKRLSAEEAKRYPLRNVLSRCIGTQEVVEPDISDIGLRPNDLVLLSTDGLSKGLELERLQEILVSGQKEAPKRLCNILVKSAIENYPNDNVTAAIVKVIDVET